MGKDVERTGRGYGSLEEYMQDCILFFHLMQTLEEGKKSLLDKEKEILSKERATEIFLPAPYIRECCRMERTEYWLVLFAFACELENGLCLDFINGGNGTWPSLQYALHLLSEVFEVDFSLIAELCEPRGSLFGMLRLPLWAREDAGNGPGIMQQPLLLNRTLFHFLLTGELRREEWCDFFLCRGGEEVQADSLPLHGEAYGILSQCLEADRFLRILLGGPEGSGKHTLMKRVLLQRQRDGIFLRMSQLRGRGEGLQEEAERSLVLLCRMLEPVVVADFGGMSQQEAKSCAGRGGRWERLFKDGYGAEAVVVLTDGTGAEKSLGAFADVQVELGEFLLDGEKKAVLDALVPREDRRPWQDGLLGRCRLNVGEMCGKLRSIRTQAQCRGIPLSEEDGMLWEEAFEEGEESGGLGRVIRDKVSPEDLVVPPDCRRQLEMLAKLTRAWRERADVKGRRKGLQFLFHGSSGTGKTMAASVIATDLNMPLFKVDLSCMLDKYVGETEKHIEEVFRMAERRQYILFFDEADALFSKRTDIKDSVDRYANVSTAYLLQRMEGFDGILILATNLLNHFDDAFLRRIRFLVKFRNLDEKERETLWEKLLEGDPPKAAEVSPRALARAVEFSPARMQAVAETAKLLALGEGCGNVMNRHLRDALELEAGKDGTVIAGKELTER